MRAKPTNDTASSFSPAVVATGMPLLLDMPGLFFVEATYRIESGKVHLAQLLAELERHRARVAAAASRQTPNQADDAWVEVIHGVGGLEPLFGATIAEFAVADVLLVVAAESYINAIASHVLSSSDTDHFEKLSPVGKWLFLPRLMKLKWQPSLDHGALQQFVQLVGRRNRVVHPRIVRVDGPAHVELFVKHLRLDAKLAVTGIEAVRDLIREISLSWRGSYGPDWLHPDRAAAHPPCFIIGSVEVSGRLGRPKSVKKRGRT